MAHTTDDDTIRRRELQHLQHQTAVLVSFAQKLLADRGSTTDWSSQSQIASQFALDAIDGEKFCMHLDVYIVSQDVVAGAERSIHVCTVRGRSKEDDRLDNQRRTELPFKPERE